MTILTAFLLAALVEAPRGASDEPLGRRSAFDFSQSEDRIELAAGTRVRAQPDFGAAPLVSVATDTELDILERSDGWARVRHLGWVGWVPLPETQPPPPTEPARTAISEVPVFEAIDDSGERQLEVALSYLPASVEARPFGPFTLYTDVNEASVLDRWGRIAAALPSAYSDRFDLQQSVDAAGDLGVVVIYEQAESYRAFADKEALPASSVEGHSSHGVAALFSGGRSRSESVEAVLVHEMTHLINRGVLGIGMPVWLEEGLANDLSSARISKTGQIRLGTWRGGTTLRRNAWGRMIFAETSGPVAGRRRLFRAWQQRLLPTLTELMMLPPEDFIDPEVRSLNYALATDLVRFLVDSGDTSLSDGFSSFLRAVADGSPPSIESLEAHLGAEIVVLERAFSRWLTAQGLQLAE